MGRYRRKVKPQKSHTSRRKGNAKKSFMRTFKRTCALIFASALVLFFIVNPPFFRSFVRKSELLYQNIELRIHERSGVFTSIEKGSEVMVKRWTKFKQSSFFLEVLPQVKMLKLWQGIRKNIPDDYEIRREEVVNQNEWNVLDVEIVYKDVPFCFLTFRQNTRGQFAHTAPAPVPRRYVKRTVEKQQRVPLAVSTRQKVHVAFIIDDIGYNRKYEDLLFSLPEEITLSILPQLPFSQYYSHKGHAQGNDVLLHLPLEAENSAIDPGPGTIRVSMNKDTIEDILEENLASVPHAIGINNHMGSKATANKEIMRIILHELKKKRIFFLDSVTSQNTVVRYVAEEKNLSYLRRDVFLDNNNDPSYIKMQVEELISVARKKGMAIGIGHYRRNTLRVLAEVIPQLQREGIEVVRVSDLVE